MAVWWELILVSFIACSQEALISFGLSTDLPMLALDTPTKATSHPRIIWHYSQEVGWAPAEEVDSINAPLFYHSLCLSSLVGREVATTNSYSHPDFFCFWTQSSFSGCYCNHLIKQNCFGTRPLCVGSSSQFLGSYLDILEGAFRSVPLK